MSAYLIKSADQLSDPEIATILVNWGMEEWLSMGIPMFKEKFSRTVFHLLIDKSENILSLARINNDFSLCINGMAYSFAEFVGFVSVEKQKGYGSLLLQEIIKQAKKTEVQMIGFCIKELRAFYQKNGLDLLADKARAIYEEENGEWVSSTDDDIVVLNLSEENKELLNGLGSECRAYFIS